MSAVTIADVAREAGVSVTTVSHALSGNGRVSEQTRKKVREAAAAIGYAPNLHARSLNTRRSNTLALVVPDNSNPYYPQLVAGAESVARSAGFTTVLCNTAYDRAQIESHVQMLLGWGPDAVVYVLSTPDDDGWMALRASIRALVLCDELPDDLDGSISSVEIDNHGAGALAAEHLAQLGHRDVAFAGSGAGMRAGRLRFEGFRDSFLRHVPSGSVAELEAGYVVEGGRGAARELRARAPRATGVFCANDLIALGLIAELRDRGLRVPEDVSVLGMDDVLPAEIMTPPLTTVAQPTREMGAIAARIALDLLEHERTGAVTEQLPPSLVVRASTSRVVSRREVN